MIDKNLFRHPPRSLGISPMSHRIDGDVEDLLAYYDQCHHAGAVINAPFDDGFTSNPDNLARLGELIKALKKAWNDLLALRRRRLSQRSGRRHVSGRPSGI